MDPLVSTAAAFFRYKGKNVVTENEFIMGISMDLRWVTPSSAGELLSLLLGYGHLKKDGEYLRPTFDVGAVDVPLGFRPPADILKSASNRPADVPDGAVKRSSDGDLLARLMTVAESAGMKKKDLIVSVNALQKRINVDIEIAALLMLREKGVDISGYIGNAYELISNR
ncbi:MAG: DUF2240 family protein [Methanomassiliicoccaceae archaeon]|nr:DUF2240 family protein [Methanomassiliicoccaceae archaeon]